jgi:hypothetical protein
MSLSIREVGSSDEHIRPCFLNLVALLAPSAMSEKHEYVGAETERHNTIDDDVQKSGHIKEANVASVALGKSQILSKTA